MSTQSDSLIRVSRRERDCTQCAGKIRVGHRYLSYAPGQRSRYAFCMTCMLGERFRDLLAVRQWREQHA